MQAATQAAPAWKTHPILSAADCVDDFDQVETVGMWDEEAAHPWRSAALYAAMVGGAMLASHIVARGGL